LHSTSYGIHCGIDLHAAGDGAANRVLSPVQGTVYRVYHPDADPDDRRRNKVVNIYGDEPVGPAGERILYRFHHLSEIHVSDGESVRPGQVIGVMGHTGFDPGIGDHLHFEMRLNPSCLGQPYDDDLFSTVPVNPYPYLLEWWRDAEGAR
jgi:murein DD-endopeptidase MepM/ murein hydrolase activator NlpD